MTEIEKLKPAVTNSPYIVGIPVNGTKVYYGREKEACEFFRRVGKIGNAQLQPFEIRGLRRSGKTSFMCHVAARETAKRYLSKEAFQRVIIAYVNLQGGIRSPSDFFSVVSETIASSCNNGCLPDAPSSPLRYLDFTYWLKNVLGAGGGRTIVVLLDEFEALSNSKQFDADFFGYLRSVMETADRKSFVWIPSSFKGVAELTDPPGKTSPLYNQYNDNEIVLGSLTDVEATALVTEPAAECGVSISAPHVLKISGQLPLFVQAVADRWYLAKQTARQNDTLTTVVQRDLLRADGLIGRILESCWNALTENEQQCVRSAALGLEKIHLHNPVAVHLCRFGLLRRNGRTYSVPSQLLVEWMRSANLPIAGQRKRVFVCYARADNSSRDNRRRWLDRLLEHLQPLLDGQYDVWSDDAIEVGSELYTEIDNHLGSATAAVLLVSSSFLNSDFIRQVELPRLLQRAERGEIRIFPLILSANVAADIELRFPNPQVGPNSRRLSDFKALPMGTSLANLEYAQQEEIFVEFARSLNQFLNM